MATRLPVPRADNAGLIQPSRQPRSTISHSIVLIVTGSSSRLSVQAASQGAGQTRPVNSGKLLVRCSRSSAACHWSRLTRSFQSGIRLFTGQPEWQKGTPQSMQRSACFAVSGGLKRLDEFEPVLHPLGGGPVGPVAAVDLEEAGGVGHAASTASAASARRYSTGITIVNWPRARAPIGEDLGGAGRAGQRPVPLDQTAQPFRIVDRLQRDPGRVALRLQPAVRIPDIGDAARHAGGEVAPDPAEHDHAPAGHIFAAMVARALDHRDRARIAHREALARDAGEEGLARGRAVEAGVADDDVRRGLARHIVGLADDQPAAGQALAGIIVGVAGQRQREAGREEGAEALPRGAGEPRGQAGVGQALMAVAPRHFAREQGRRPSGRHW